MKDLQGMIRDIEQEADLTSSLTGKKALDDRVMTAMRQVPRHHFIPIELHARAYDNGPLPIGLGQTISQPFIVALMSDLLQTKSTDVILEIGTGSGYQTAVLSCLARRIYSVELIDDLAIEARKRLKHLDYNNIEIRNGDGCLGWPEHAPYDGIIVTAAAPVIPKALIDQLRPSARLVIPVGFPYSYQELMVVDKKSDGKITLHKVLGVSFVPLITNDPDTKLPYTDHT